MKITNKHGIPQTLYALANKEFYSKGDSDYSATEIISPPRIQRLRKRHHDDIEQDAADMLWSMLGSALHVVAERSIIPNHINEERLTTEVNGVRLSGAIDLQKVEDDGIVISDYKFTSAWALMNDKPEWEQQQNIYAYLVEKVKGKKVKRLEIIALVRDWSRRDAMYKSTYPQAAIQVVEIPLWGIEKTEAYIKERIELHRDSKVSADWMEELPECSEDDKWVRETKFAVKKEGRKTAVRVFDTQQEADELLATLPAKDKGFVEIRKGEPVRCTGNFCGVNQWCSQYQAYLAEQATTETQE
jgi:hypothetical protein